LRFLNKASQVIVTADFFKKEIIKRFQINEEKIKVIYPAVDNGFKKINFEEKELIKEKYAAGNEYFIYKGTISPQQNLLNLLKAFSFFKKRQKSTMQLLVVGNYGINSAEFLESLRLFRFKNEVKVLAELTEKEIQKAVAAAYAMVYVPVYDDKPASVLEAMNCHVPLVISSIDNLKEYCGDAALFSDPQNHKDIAEKLMMIFKDEKLRKELIEKEAIQLKQIAGNKKDSDFFNLIKDVQKNISSNEEI
jgi:glycosyltransferase involved in cell wall biosynthesis